MAGETAYLNAVLADSPTGMWRLQGGPMGAPDSYPVPQHGFTIPGTPGCVPQVIGYYAGGAAGAFDGIDGSLTGPLSQANASKVTFECWFNWPTYANDAKILAEWANTNGTPGFFVVPNHASGSFFVGYFNSGGQYDTSQFTRPSAGWHHLVVVFDLQATIGLRTIPYVDGVAVGYTKAGTNTQSGTTFNGGTQTLKVGGGLSTVNFSAVSLSEVAIWVGTALSGAQIAAHYNAREGQ